MLGEHLVFMQQKPSSIPSMMLARPKFSSLLIHVCCPLQEILESITHDTERKDQKYLKEFQLFLIKYSF